MDSIKLILTPNDRTEVNDDIAKMISLYLGSLSKNGQILRNYEIVKSGTEYYAYLTLPEKNSLDENYNSKYSNEYLMKLKELFHLKIEYIGDNINHDASCFCISPSWYMLYTDWTLIESPVVCGDCGKEVPLYKLPYLQKRDDHYEIYCWQIAYTSIDNIWLHGLSDRFSYRQMNDPRSQLAKEGREICAELENLTGKPVYYYIFNNKKTKANCPDCGTSWEQVKDCFIDFRCEKCRLVADEVPICLR